MEFLKDLQHQCHIFPDGDSKLSHQNLSQADMCLTSTAENQRSRHNFSKVIIYLSMSAPLVASKEVHAKVKLLLGEQIVCQETHEDVDDLNNLEK